MVVVEVEEHQAGRHKQQQPRVYRRTLLLQPTIARPRVLRWVDVISILTNSPFVEAFNWAV